MHNSNSLLNEIDEELLKNVANKTGGLYFRATDNKKLEEIYNEINKLEKTEDFPQQVGDLLKHQKLIARFFSSHTLYDELLMVHEMGTGKSCSAVGAVEQIRSEGGGFKGAVAGDIAASSYYKCLHCGHQYGLLYFQYGNG